MFRNGWCFGVGTMHSGSPWARHFLARGCSTGGVAAGGWSLMALHDSVSVYDFLEVLQCK